MTNELKKDTSTFENFGEFEAKRLTSRASINEFRKSLPSRDSRESKVFVDKPIE